MALEHSEKPTILVDMDGVIANFNGGVHARMQALYPDVTPLDPMPDPPGFYIADHYPKEHRDLVRSIYNEEGFIASLPLVPDALEGWERIMEAGFRPQICSSPLSSNAHSESEKRAWLDQHFAHVFGSWVTDTAVIVKEKHLVPGRSLIDDRPHIENADQATWEHIVFDQPWNRGVDKARILGWTDPVLPLTLNAGKAGMRLPDIFGGRD